MSLTKREEEILTLIKQNPLISREEIAEYLDISPSATGTHLYNLTNKGYILGKGYITAPEKRIVVVGGSNMDLKGYASEAYIEGSSTPGHLTESLGGVGRNIVENLGLLDCPTVFLSAVGKDLYGEEIIKETEKSSLNLDYVLRSNNYRSGTYLAHLDTKGELIGAIVDMKILKEINKDYIYNHRQLIENALLLVIDTNLEQETIDYLLELAEAKGITTLIEPVSVSKSNKIKDNLDQIDILTPNLDEAVNIFDLDLKKNLDINTKLELLVEEYQNESLRMTMVITLGKEGVFIITPDSTKLVAAEPIDSGDIVEITGAGDALTAGLVYGLWQEESIEDAVRIGLKSAKLTIMDEATVSKKLNNKLN